MRAEETTAADYVLDVESAWAEVIAPPEQLGAVAPPGSHMGAPAVVDTPTTLTLPDVPLPQPVVTADVARRRRNRFLVGVATAAVVLPLLALQLPGSTGAPAANASRATRAKHHGKESEKSALARYAALLRDRAHGSTTTTAVPSSAGDPARASTASSTSDPASTVAATTRRPAAARSTARADPAGVPAKVAQAAVGIIHDVDAQSKGRYHIQATSDNVVLLGRWMANEGGLWADNPLNTSLYANRYRHQVTSSGVNTGIPIFPSMSTGMAATAATLLHNGAYAKILRLLAAGDSSCVSFARAVIHSPWATSHYGYDPHAFCQVSPSNALQTENGRENHR